MGPSRHSQPLRCTMDAGGGVDTVLKFVAICEAMSLVRFTVCELLCMLLPMLLQFNRACRDFIALMVVQSWRVSTQARATAGGAARTMLLEGGSTWRAVGFGWGVGVG